MACFHSGAHGKSGRARGLPPCLIPHTFCPMNETGGLRWPQSSGRKQKHRTPMRSEHGSRQGTDTDPDCHSASSSSTGSHPGDRRKQFPPALGCRLRRLVSSPGPPPP